MSFLDKIDRNRIPQHVAIIMDGNGRWAQNQGQERIFGHFNGVEAVRDSLKAAVELGVNYLTLYAFSTENWNRPKEEVDALMDLLVNTIIGEADELNENGVRLLAIGDIENLPVLCRDNLKSAMKRTEKNKVINLVLALSYSSRWELVNAYRLMMQKGIRPEDLNEKTMSEYLCTSGMPDPELLIRTSGEKRISNFLLWQIAYSELYFTETLWPDFRREEFYKAVHDFQHRERRFGKTSQQLTLG
jgi:undecaprenyl diphosphate synthase